MNRTLAILAAFLIGMTAAACSLTAMMVPVEGPLSRQRPVPILRVKVNGIMGNSGDLRFILPTGDACAGRWSSAAGAGITVGSAGLLSEYGSTYLSGYAVSTGTGQNPGLALATCDDGRAFQLEFLTGAGTAHGFGIGKDDDENIYRFIF